MLNGDITPRHCFADEEVLQDWEQKLIEWCFEFPEKDICGTYFNALLNKNFRKCLHGGI